MKISKTYAIMFAVADGGVSDPISWGKENLKPENIIMVIDEENLTVWLWHGKKRGLVSRRTALRQAESLKGHGYTVGKSIVGRGMEKIVEIDERKIGRDPETDENNNKFMELLNRKVTDVGNFIVTFGNGGGEDSVIENHSSTEVKKDIAMKIQPFSPSDQSEPMVPPPKTPPVQVSAPVLKPKPKTELKSDTISKSEPESKSIVLKPTPKPEPKPEPKPVERPTLTPIQKTPSNGFNGSSGDADEYSEDVEIPPMESSSQEKTETNQELLSTHEESQMGLVIMAVLSQFKDIWISKRDDGKVIIEQMDGRVCSFSIEAGKVKFEPGSFSEIDPTIKDAIHNRFVNLIKGLK